MDKIVTEKKEGFFVWNKKGHQPRYVHGSAAAAEMEAIRLARLHPGRKFIVMQAISKIHVVKEPDDQTT